MCYSKEVQLITATIIFISVAWYWYKYSQIYKKSEKKWMLPFLHTTLMSAVFIGLHQLFEFLTIVTENQIIYKIGLIFSISAMYCLIRSFEILSNRNIHSKVALVIIAAIAVYIFFTPLDFNTSSFYMQHNSTYFWAAAWLILFIYWHLSIYWVYSTVKEEKEKKIFLLYTLAVLDISFILSTLYVLFGYFFLSLNVCTDAPSIWCTFFVIQAFFIPIILKKLPAYTKREKIQKEESLTRTLAYFLISIAIVAILSGTLLLFRCLTWKFVFP